MDITIDKVANNLEKYILIDVRSPKEYEDGTIYEAINIPILDNEARHLVGTIYKLDKDKAYQEGLKYGTSRLPVFYDEIKKLKEAYPEKEIVVFCARGGTRSSSVVTVMNMMKLNCFKLVGGHKEYRQYLLTNLEDYINKINLLVVSGNTGSGKTIVLNELEKEYPVLDLEGFANHRGSIFGEIGLDIVTQKTFEDRLFFKIKEYIDNNVTDIFIESESRKIGTISLPNNLYEKILSSAHLLLDVSVDRRVDILLDVYKPEEVDIDLVKKIIVNNKYFKLNQGAKWVEEMVELLEKKDFKSFIKNMIVDYYDKLYYKSQRKYDYKLNIKSDDLDEIVSILGNYYKEKRL